MAKLRVRVTQGSAHQKALLLALLAGTLSAFVVTSGWFALNNQARDHIEAANDNAGRITELLIREDLEHRLAALERFARRWNKADGTPRSIWEADAATYIEDMPGFQAIAWADATLHIRWVVPLIGNEAVQDLNIGAAEPARPALTVARETGKVALTQPFDLALGGFGISAYTPVMRGDKFDGVTVGVLRLNSWLNEIFKNLIATEHHVRVFVDGIEVYTSDPFVEPISNEWITHREFSVHDLAFTTVVAPTNEFLSAAQTRWSSLLLIAGMLLSVLIATAVYQAMMSRFSAGRLRETTHRMATLFQNLPGMVYRCFNEPSWPMEFVSEGCQTLSGYSPGDFVEQRVIWGDLIHPEDRVRVWRTVQQAVDADVPFEVEYRVTTRVDEERWMWDRGRLISQTDDDIRCLEGFITDITDRKLVEAALIQEQAYSYAIVDTAIEAVITVGGDDRIETFNRAAQNMYGYTPEEVIGKRSDFLLPKAYKKLHRENVKRYVQTGVADFSVDGQVVEGLRKDGSQFPMQYSVSEIEHQTEMKFVCLVRDISLQHAAEQEARQHREELAHADRLNMLGEMATGIAHEINQPLTAISLFSQAGKRLLDAGNQERLPEIFDKLSQHAQRAGAVIERVQGLARQHETSKEIVDCKALFTDVAKLAEAEARIWDIDIKLDTQSDLPQVAVDAVQIQQVALNLLRNGMEAMRSVACCNGNTIRLQTSLCDNGEIEVAVIDSGCGVADEVASKLFTPFSTTKESGMGMGLSICRAIVTAHGGQLAFHNNDTSGATFYFTLPALEQGDQDIE